MKTLHLCRRSVNNRSSHQTARPGWRPRKCSPRQLAQDIAASIRKHRAAGHTHYIHPHEFTPNPETQAHVLQLLAADAE
ncbi:hypothetical protein C2W62_18555 [Candidatus Entotheonella serta]|nr:hypothetical protein C2W62_18555 [Candidatus Entotheonella serta]